MSAADAPAQPPSGARSIRVDWEQYYRLIERLAALVHRSGYSFDSLVCLARGGMRVGDVLSRVFQVPLAILSTSSYREDAGTRAGALEIAATLTTTGGAPRGRVLLVDDLVDSGNTLEQVARHLRGRFPDIVEVRSAVLWFKGGSRVTPDYFVEHLPDNPWIHQPFERYDQLRPADLPGANGADAGGG